MDERVRIQDITTVKVGFHRYAVVCSDGAWKEAMDFGGTKYQGFGATHHIMQKIFLNPSQQPTQMADTLMHEIWHVVKLVSGWDGDDMVKVDDSEEYVIKTMNSLWCQVIAENPVVIRFVQEANQP
jgi:hypothetical protein